MATRPVNVRTEAYDVYIGRPSKWGNPFQIGMNGTREEVIRQYENWLQRRIDDGTITREDLKKLYGKRLGCYCKPQACHGDILANIVEELCQE